MQPVRFLFFSILFLVQLQAVKSQCVTASVTPNTNLCVGDTVHLTCGFDPSCFATTLPTGCVDKTDSLSTQYLIQSGNPYTTPSVYGNFYKGARFQFLYTAAEIGAVFDAGYIEQLAWRIGQFNSNASLENFTIAIKSVPADSTVLTTWETGLSTVYGPQIYTPNVTLSSSWNIHPLSTPYYWDGVSNLVVEIIRYNPFTSSNLVNKLSVTNETGKAIYAMTNNDPYTVTQSPIAVQERPVLRMKMCMTDQPPVFVDTSTNIYWTSTGPDTVQYDTTGNAFARITADQTYKANVLKNGILRSSSGLPVNLLKVPQVLPNTSFTLCNGDSRPVYTQQTYGSYLWSNGDTTPVINVVDSGWYSVTVTTNKCTLASLDSVQVHLAQVGNAEITITSGSGNGEYNILLTPQAAAVYRLHQTYDTLNGSIQVSNITGSQVIYTCYLDSSGTVGNSFVRGDILFQYGCRDTTAWAELTGCVSDLASDSKLLWFSIYPNPVTDIVFVEMPDAGINSIETEVTDMQGRIVYSNIYNQNSISRIAINTAKLAQGTYLLKMRSGTKTGQAFFVK